MQIPTGTDTDRPQQTGTESSLTARTDHCRPPRNTARIPEQPAASRTGSPLYSPADSFSRSCIQSDKPFCALSARFFAVKIPNCTKYVFGEIYKTAKTAHLLAFCKFQIRGSQICTRFFRNITFCKAFLRPEITRFRRRFRDSQPGLRRRTSAQAVPGLPCFLRRSQSRL